MLGKLGYGGGPIFKVSFEKHTNAHAIALHMRKPLLCTCAPHCFAHARPIIPRTSTIRKHASRKNSPYQKLDKYTDFTCFNKDIHEKNSLLGVLFK